ncbi:MAG: sodium:solute symporter family protein [Candidatus Marinimicrobia bacterium]|jgi:Na+/proline symporter|nr:sodium:solute symporter family protein [Candidatus Neomarinimicrobiota bacterium]MDP7120772.1 sodium:solute symporter family protein [Candidatus Neomarinimicrobiota bacterium]MDP7483314.1 sodium:solute symporter family protein [Candidatus Neomarinimicrobiota bacterium]MDP7716663.1 sodium:solute symporter family protein [Candidatus Neomarinimicrobiota bacterium]
MDTKLLWLTVFVGVYWAYCLFWGFKGARSARTSADYFLAGRTISLWVFVLAATATSFSGWTFVGHPGKIFTDGLPYAFASFYALTIPFTGVLFLRRQWVLGRAFKYITPGEMYSDYYGGNAIRLLTVLVAFLFSVPYLGVQLRASGDLFNVLTDGLVSVNFGMVALSVIVVIYVASGGLRSVAYVDCVQCVLLALGICILGGVTIHFSGGWTGFVEGMSEYVRGDFTSNKSLTPAGHSPVVAIPGSIQMVSTGSKATGGTWTGIMCMTYMFALMGIQSSPAFSMWAFSNKTSKPFRWQQVVASSVVIGIILFTFTIIQGMGGHVLIANGTLESANDKNLVPQLINLLSQSSPWLMGLLAVCALAAMQSTGAAYMSTFSAMVTRDIYKRYIAPEASDSAQKLGGRLMVVVVAGAALVVAAKSTSAIVMLGGLAVAYGFQMYPALMGVCYFPWLTKKGVVLGLSAGLIAVTLTDRTAVWFGVPWGAYPLTIHSAGWGIFFNLLVALVVSKRTNETSKEKEWKEKRHRFLQAVSGLSPDGKKKVSLAWGLTLVWFLVGFGPFATIGNTLFSDPNNPASWAPFGLPSLWVWQLLFLLYGIFVMWFLAFQMGLSEPVDPEKVEKYHKEHFN